MDFNVWAFCSCEEKLEVSVLLLAYYFLSFLFYASDMNINVEHRKLWCQFFRIDLLNEEEEEKNPTFHCLQVRVTDFTR